MKKIKTIFLITAVMFCASQLFAGGQQEFSGPEAAAEAAPSTITVTDFLGREVTIEMPIERIIFTHYASAEALKILDVWDLVVGRDGYTGDEFIYPDMNEIPALAEMMGGPYTPNMELLYSLNPDLFILEVIPMPGIEELLKDLDGVVPVVTVQTYDPEGMFNSMENLGRLLDREAEAAEFIAWVKGVQQSLLDKTGNLSDAEKTKVFYKSGYGGVEELMTFSNEMSYVPVRDRFSGAINIAADLPSQGGWVPSLDAEWLAQQDMDVLIISDPQPGGYGVQLNDSSKLAAHREKVMALPVFTDTTAVRTGRVYMFGDTFFGTPRHIIGFACLAKWMHPELFEDLDPAVLHQDYFDKFLRIDADVINNGLFVYPKE